MTTISSIVLASFRTFSWMGLLIAILALSAQGVRSQRCRPDWETYPDFQTNAVYAVFEHDGILYRGGWFSLFRWDGSQWETFGGGIGGDAGTLYAADIKTYGGVLVIGGRFPTAGGTIVNSIATWDGAAFGPVGGGVDGEIQALVVFDGDLIAGGTLLGTQVRKAALSVASYAGLLYVGADFTKAVNKKASAIAVWNGQRWKPVGQGLDDSDAWPIGVPTVRELEVVGGSLLIGRKFDEANNEPTDNVARYTDCDVATGVRIDNLPKPFRIVSVSPNPFNPSTTVRFALPAAMRVTAEIWSVTGARVRTLANEKPFGKGDHQLTWDGRTDQGSPAASGVYLIRLKTRLGAKITRAVLLK